MPVSGSFGYDPGCKSFCTGLRHRACSQHFIAEGIGGAADFRAENASAG